MVIPPKNIRLKEDQYVGVRIYFVTVCCHQRQRAFERAEVTCSAIEKLRNTANRNHFGVHAYCFMPNHLHFLAEGTTHESKLLDFVERFKQSTAFAYRQKYHEALWQARFFDHILRSSETMQDVASYIWLNPVRQGLCASPYDYPFSGSLSFSWKKERLHTTGTWVPPWKLVKPRSNTPG